MKILVLLNPTAEANAEQMRPHLLAETQHAYEMYRSGVARELYFRQDARGAVMILECKDVAEAAEVIAELPLAKAGFLKPEIIPLAPFAVWDRLGVTPAK